MIQKCRTIAFYRSELDTTACVLCRRTGMYPCPRRPYRPILNVVLIALYRLNRLNLAVHIDFARKFPNPFGTQEPDILAS